SNPRSASARRSYGPRRMHYSVNSALPSRSHARPLESDEDRTQVVVLDSDHLGQVVELPTKQPVHQFLVQGQILGDVLEIVWVRMDCRVGLRHSFDGDILDREGSSGLAGEQVLVEVALVRSQ